MTLKKSNQPEFNAEMDEETGSGLPEAGLAEDFLKTSPRKAMYGEKAKKGNGDRRTAPEGAGAQEGNRTELVTFFLDKEEYGLPISVVQEINRVGVITEVPNAPKHIRGVINLRGKIVPVIELKRRLELGATIIDKNSRIVVVENGPKVLGLMVDRVAQVCTISAEQIEETPKEVMKSDHKYIHGVGKIEDRMILLLALDRVVQEARE